MRTDLKSVKISVSKTVVVSLTPARLELIYTEPCDSNAYNSNILFY